MLKKCSTSVQLDRVAFFRSDFFQNWYFRSALKRTPVQDFNSFSIMLYYIIKGQLISKKNCQAENSPKKRTNEFVFTSMRRVFVCFLGESSARKKNVSRLSDLQDLKAKVFYYVNYVIVNYSIKNSTVDCKRLLYFHDFQTI